MIPIPGTVRFLASVRSPEEALLALEGGANIIDCKEPIQGALGMLGRDVVAAIRRTVPADIPISATIGDDATEQDDAGERIARMAAAGADYVKIGFEPGPQGSAALLRIGELAGPGVKLIAVLAADDELALDMVAGAAASGFSGVMLDTVRKESYSLPVLWPDASLKSFIAAARHKNLLVGLAGALRLRDVERLTMLQPDILGFRGALCVGQNRSGPLSRTACEQVCRAIAGAPGAAGVFTS